MSFAVVTFLVLLLWRSKGCRAARRSLKELCASHEDKLASSPAVWEFTIRVAFKMRVSAQLL